tara:strand:+ start:305 stop:634 length:330 start_codon:yes stop_codon:yes gene_type:complete
MRTAHDVRNTEEVGRLYSEGEIKIGQILRFPEGDELVDYTFEKKNGQVTSSDVPEGIFSVGQNGEGIRKYLILPNGETKEIDYYRPEDRFFGEYQDMIEKSGIEWRDAA